MPDDMKESNELTPEEMGKLANVKDRALAEEHFLDPHQADIARVVKIGDKSESYNYQSPNQDTQGVLDQAQEIIFKAQQRYEHQYEDHYQKVQVPEILSTLPKDNQILKIADEGNPQEAIRAAREYFEVQSISGNPAKGAFIFGMVYEKLKDFSHAWKCYKLAANYPSPKIEEEKTDYVHTAQLRLAQFSIQKRAYFYLLNILGKIKLPEGNTSSSPKIPQPKSED